ncbi:antibiotic biosynthesis monooxygenase [Kordiimonas sp. SCSIO 12610]|uniref:antibiotic biosynthesis monooxygenase family protein n=1 Tax=Kordiimonas sp. SCSIO 12610 TaxID=2829597 RepID=UPI002108E709|nr:antibiotic biosynthesis monooxygenase [Kordiimonas sp. SCSIO 12610]UTW54623.1 antibiotic biosynthesis monooxygenase [Kordiimonas sp. SCSIO 12610]
MSNLPETPIVELVVYKIKQSMQATYVNTSIEEFREFVMSFEGCISYEFYKCMGEPNVFMDIVKWETLELAEKAARRVKIYQKRPEFSAYLASFETVDIFNHFNLQKSWKQN